jgi:hypothetical protein
MRKTFGNERKGGFLPDSALLLLLLFVPFLLFTACQNEVSPETGKEIIGFTLQRDVGTGAASEKEDFYDFDFEIYTEKAKIDITIPERYPITKLCLQVEVSEGAETDPTNDALADLTIDPINGSKITVTAENGDTKLWTVYVQKDPPPNKDIVKVALQKVAGGESIAGIEPVIDAEKGEILIPVPKGNPINNLYLQVVEVSKEAIANPVNPLLDPIYGTTITVTAVDGSTKEWKVSIQKETPDKDIVGVALQKVVGGENIAGIEPVIDAEKGEVAISVPRGNPIDKLYLQVSVSAGASADPTNAELNGRYMNFTGEKITVTDEDGGTKVWTVSAKQESSPVQELAVELLGNYQVRFLFAYPNYKETNGTSPAYVSYDSPILLSYFGDDNDIEQGGQAGTYYNTLIVSAGGFATRQWKIDGKTAPIREGTSDYYGYNASTTLTIHAQDWTLEEPHTVTFIGTKIDERGNEQKYSGEFTFKVVEKIPAAAE